MFFRYFSFSLNPCPCEKYTFSYFEFHFDKRFLNARLCASKSVSRDGTDLKIYKPTIFLSKMEFL